DVLDKCNVIVEQYRAGAIEKARAYLAIQQTMPADDEAVFLAALEAQMRAIDSIDRLRNTGGARGGAAAAGLGGSAGQSKDSGNDRGGNEDVQPVKRPRSRQDDDDDGQSARKRIQTELFAWSIGNEIDKAILHPVVVETNRQLENFSRDLKGAKTNLLNTFSRPQFPDEEWGSLLSGRPVDLDRVFTSIYSVSLDSKAIERIGSVELSVGHVTPTKAIKTYGDWVTAWSAASEATLFVFPHLKADLDGYTKHVLAYFRALPAEPKHFHQRVINYDRAVRIRLSERRDLRFVDYASFTDLQLMWVSGPSAGSVNVGDGDGNKGRRSGSGARDGRKTEPCNRWNDGSCPNSPSSCRYVCRKCRSNRHSENSCPK
ncbi:hypothetical protein BD626DRAFT_369922, partial [Schizophyllum amplum]